VGWSSRTPRSFVLLPVSLALVTACGGGGGSGQPHSTASPDTPSTPAQTAPPLPGAAVDWNRDILQLELVVDVESRRATAAIQLAGSGSEAVSLESGSLHITDVVARIDGTNVALNYSVGDGAIHIGLPASTAPTTVTIHYGFEEQDGFSGVMATGSTFVWPYYCGNLFPCHSNPDDGFRFRLSLDGVPTDQRAVYAGEVSVDAPPYMPAWAVGDYSFIELGYTGAGTQVGVWHLPGERSVALAGSAHLRAVFDWLEVTYGAYPFGSSVGSVSVPWGEDAFGGIEHHPYWHVASGSMGDPQTHAHEAAHGWFGNGVRIACWEDFVLSEGVATYLAARAIEHSAGEAAAAEIWSSYLARLNRLQASPGNKIAWPQGCGVVDILEDGLFSDAPYVKGAFFFRALEAAIGRDALDQVLASFFSQFVGRAMRMQDLLGFLGSETGYDPTECARGWLQSEQVPEAMSCP